MSAVTGISVLAFGLALIYWANPAGSQTVSKDLNARQTVRMSILEIHNGAHIEFLPIQKIDDQRLIYAAAGPKS